MVAMARSRSRLRGEDDGCHEGPLPWSSKVRYCVFRKVAELRWLPVLQVRKMVEKIEDGGATAA
ncbi:hypothetical protein DEO72_LG11g1934 [Vigna unguiculata]|uniref:Uncharacterized protein n=1 Tax=Vigna unguiculata TaxID=3917 RepID=A0A4D6NNL2_VIGUN|nr:hypothetical protein DEO72_LG11g1934 [Vigna unguiculata]